jgi:hypothetical protein
MADIYQSVQPENLPPLVSIERVPCPKCGAPVGKSCRTPSGHPTAAHGPRMVEARRAAEAVQRDSRQRPARGRPKA